MRKPFADFDLSDFWESSPYATESYIEAPLTPAAVAEVERELGFKLPASYLALMATQNGGIPKNTCFPMNEPTSWSSDHVAISGIFGVGRSKLYSLCGSLGSKFMQEEWGYPEIGICVCDCPSAGHDMIMLDYRACGPSGEPRVVHVDQESDYEITDVAENFEEFIRGLVNQQTYEPTQEDRRAARAATLEIVARGSFSSTLNALLAPGDDAVIRDLCRRVVEQKGHFSLHEDPLSFLVYDYLFLLFARSKRARDRAAYLKAYPEMLVFGDGTFQTGGYGPGFVENWFDRRVASGEIVSADGALTLSASGRARVLAEVAALR